MKSLPAISVALVIAVGLAVLVTIASTVTSHASHTTAHLDALVHGYRVALLVNAGIMLVAALAALGLQSAPPAQHEPQASLRDEPATSH